MHNVVGIEGSYKMGRRSEYRITKEDAEDITEFKEWVENLLKKDAKETREKKALQTDDFDYDGLNSMFDFSLSMEKEEQKTAHVKKQTKEKEIIKESMEKMPHVAQTPNIAVDIEPFVSIELEEDTEYDDFEK